MIKALFINSEKQTVTEIEIEPTFEQFYTVIGCTMIEAVHRLDNGHLIYADEEANIKTEKPKNWFCVVEKDTAHTPVWIAGNGLIVGIAGENETSIAPGFRVRLNFFKAG